MMTDDYNTNLERLIDRVLLLYAQFDQNNKELDTKAFQIFGNTVLVATVLVTAGYENLIYGLSGIISVFAAVSLLIMILVMSRIVRPVEYRVFPKPEASIENLLKWYVKDESALMNYLEDAHKILTSVKEVNEKKSKDIELLTSLMILVIVFGLLALIIP